MKQQYIDEMEKIIDEEIEIYSNIEQSVIDKREILVKAKVEELKKIDTRLIEQATDLEKVLLKRRKTSKDMGCNNITLKDLIEKTKDIDTVQSKRFSDKQTRLKKIVENIRKVNEINTALVKHSLIIVEKSIKAIMNVAAPETASYGMDGKATKKINPNVIISSIEKEA